MRRFNSFVLMAAALAAGAGRAGAAAEDFGASVRRVGGFARPQDVPAARAYAARSSTWNPLAAMRVSRRNRLNGRKGGRR